MDFVIDRSKWRCGQGIDEKTQCGIGVGVSSLANDEGFNCCLGLIGQQCGVPRSTMKGKFTPADVDAFLESAPFLCRLVSERDDDDGDVIEYTVNSTLAESAMEINDDSRIGLQERERLLTELFANNGHTLTFTGEPVIPGKGA